MFVYIQFGHVILFFFTYTTLYSGTYLPSIASSLDTLNIFQAFINELPSIAVLWIVLRVPRMMGTSAGSAIASAGQIAGGAVVAVGAAAYQIV